MGKTITIQLDEENAKHLESFLQVFMPTHKFQPPNAGYQIKALEELYDQIRKALDDSKSK